MLVPRLVKMKIQNRNHKQWIVTVIIMTCWMIRPEISDFLLPTLEFREVLFSTESFLSQRIRPNLEKKRCDTFYNRTSLILILKFASLFIDPAGFSLAVTRDVWNMTWRNGVGSPEKAVSLLLTTTTTQQENFFPFSLIYSHELFSASWLAEMMTSDGRVTCETIHLRGFIINRIYNKILDRDSFSPRLFVT